jgi:hypothetical protein
MKQNEELYCHFITLGEKFVSGRGKVTNCKVCVCCYCQQAYDDQFRIATLTKPKQYQRTGRICGGHIRICPHAKKAMRKAITAASNVAAALPANKTKPPPATSAAAARTTMSPLAMSALTNASAASASSTKTSTTKTKKLVNTSLYEHFVRPMSEEEVVDMEEKLIEMIVRCHLPFTIVERPSFCVLLLPFAPWQHCRFRVGPEPRKSCSGMQRLKQKMICCNISRMSIVA